MKKAERQKLREKAVDRRDNWDVPDVFIEPEQCLKLLDSYDRLEEALKWIVPKVHQAHHEGELEECGKSTCVEYRQALKDAEEGDV